MLSVFRKKSDAEFVEAIRSSRRRRLWGAALFFLLGANAFYFLVWEARDMHRRLLEATSVLNTLNLPEEETRKIFAQDAYFFSGVRVGHTVNLALFTLVGSVGVGVGLCRTNRRDRLLVEYSDRIRALEERE